MGMQFFETREAVNPIGPGYLYLYNWIKPFVDKKHILDIGCWSGTLEQLLEHDPCQVSGIDIENEPINFVKKRFPQYKFKKASILGKVPFQKNSFDIVLFFMVIEHLPKGTEQEALNNINAMVKKNGILFINTMWNNILSNLLDPAYFITKHRHYSEKHLRNLLENAGFKIEEVHYNGGIFTTAYVWMLYFWKHILHQKEPNNPFLHQLMARDYRNHGFCEIAIRATKVKTI